MDSLVLQALFLAAAALAAAAFYVLWLKPSLLLRRLRRSGFGGPQPEFPLGNLMEMMHGERKLEWDGSKISHDIHARVLPYFAKWRETYGKVFVYWIGTEPFIYVGEPQFLKQVTSRASPNAWGKPDVFKRDRKALFGNGLLMVEGDEWRRHREAATPAFNTPNLKAMFGVILDSASKLVDEWRSSVAAGRNEIDVDVPMNKTAAEITARISFGMDPRSCAALHGKIMRLHALLFRTRRLVGVPLGRWLASSSAAREAEALGREIDELFLSVIRERRAQREGPQVDLLGLLLAASSPEGEKAGRLRDSDVLDECKTFFFSGHETTALAISWTLLLLAAHQDWQLKLREELTEVLGDEEMDADKLARMTKMEWVFHESIRLYPTAPNVQRQAREDIRVGGVVIPRGTNMWIDTVGLNHDPAWWGDDVHEFRPERFAGDCRGGCRQAGAFSPFGRGERMCIGRSMSKMEYKIVLALLLRSFSFSLSPEYKHAPVLALTLRPLHGIPLVLHSLHAGEN